MDGSIGSTACNTKKRGGAAKHWAFTLNNWTEDEYNTLHDELKNLKAKWIIGKEIGKQNGTPHLQCALSMLDKKIRPFEHFSNKRIHWKIAEDRYKSYNYCKKEGNYIESELAPGSGQTYTAEDLGLISALYPWQQTILDMITTKPDDRSIYWFFDDGNTGKTKLCHYLVYHHNALVVDGGTKDILFGATQFIAKNKDTKQFIFLLNYSRSRQDYISYESIEKLKDGLWFSPKYESCMTQIPSPHVIIFANFTPDTSKLTMDRWKIKCIDPPPVPKFSSRDLASQSELGPALVPRAPNSLLGPSHYAVA